MPAVDVTGLAPPIQKMLRALTVSYNQQDVELLRETSTHDMVKLYSAMAGGMSADDLWVELRGSLTKRLGADYGKSALKTYNKLKVTLSYQGEPLGVLTESHGRNLVVTATEPGSPAERAGLIRGHVIKYAGGNSIRTCVDVTNAINTLHASGGMELEIEVKHSLYKLKEPEPEPEPEPEEPEPEPQIEQEEEEAPKDDTDPAPEEEQPEEEQEPSIEKEEEQPPTQEADEDAAPPEPSHEDPVPKKKPEIQIIRPITQREQTDTVPVPGNQPKPEESAPPQNEDISEAAPQDEEAAAPEGEDDAPVKEKKSKKDKKNKKKSRREDDEQNPEEIETSESPTNEKKEKRKKDKKKKRSKQKYKLVPQTDPFGNTFELRVPLSESEGEQQAEGEEAEPPDQTDEHPLSVAAGEDPLAEEDSTPTTKTTTTSSKRKKKKSKSEPQEPAGIEMRGPGEPEAEAEEVEETATPADSPLVLGEDGEVITITEPRITVSKKKKKKKIDAAEDEEIAPANSFEMEDNNEKSDQEGDFQPAATDAAEESEVVGEDEPNMEENNLPENFDPLQGPMPRPEDDPSEGSVEDQERRFHDDKTANNSFFELNNNANEENVVEGAAPEKTVFTITDVESVSVPEYATRNDVTVFSVSIATKDTTRKIWRRYTAFSDLKNCYSQLSRHLPPFPKKHLLGLNPQKLEARRVQLGIFLSSLVSIVQKATASTARPLEAFLELNNYKLTHAALAHTIDPSFGENGIVV